MKNTTFFILCFLISSISFAQNWNTLSLPSTGRYDDVFFIDENIGWAINSTNYEVSKSTDGGETWNLQFSTVDEHLRNIVRSEEHTSELQSRPHLVCRLL